MQVYMRVRASGEWCADRVQSGEQTPEQIAEYADAVAASLGLPPGSLEAVVLDDDGGDPRTGELLDVEAPAMPSREPSRLDRLEAALAVVAKTLPEETKSEVEAVMASVEAVEVKG